jgi:3-oxoacyl-[acyl-carrier-protein] synthase-3
MTFKIESIEYEVGEVELELSNIIPDFSRTFDKTGITKVYLTKGLVHEMGVKAAKKALNSFGRDKDSIKFLIYVTQSPSKVLPGDSVLVHKKLELSPSVALYDINAGCSGFVQALFLAVQLVKVLGAGMIVCSDAYREKLDPNDRSTNAVFSDAGSAVIISPDGNLELSAYSFEVETAKGPEYLVQEHMGGHLKMNGPALWEYTRGSVVRQINDLILKGQSLGIQTDRLYIHQASKLVVDGISSKIRHNNIKIPQNYSLYGNSVSSTLPILMRDDIDAINKDVSLLAGFGVGIMSVCVLIKGRNK